MKFVMAAVMLGIFGIIGYTIVRGVYTGSDTSGWSTIDITVAGLLGTILLVVVIVGMLAGVNKMMPGD